MLVDHAGRCVHAWGQFWTIQSYRLRLLPHLAWAIGMVPGEIVDELAAVFDEHLLCANAERLHFEDNVGRTPRCGDQDGIDGMLEQLVRQLNLLAAARYVRARLLRVGINDQRKACAVEFVLLNKGSRFAGSSPDGDTLSSAAEIAELLADGHAGLLRPIAECERFASEPHLPYAWLEPSQGVSDLASIGRFKKLDMTRAALK